MPTDCFERISSVPTLCADLKVTFSLKYLSNALENDGMIVREDQSKTFGGFVHVANSRRSTDPERDEEARSRPPNSLSRALKVLGSSVSATSTSASVATPANPWPLSLTSTERRPDR